MNTFFSSTQTNPEAHKKHIKFTCLREMHFWWYTNRTVEMWSLNKTLQCRYPLRIKPTKRKIHFICLYWNFMVLLCWKSFEPLKLIAKTIKHFTFGKYLIVPSNCSWHSWWYSFVSKKDFSVFEIAFTINWINSHSIVYAPIVLKLEL